MSEGQLKQRIFKHLTAKTKDVELNKSMNKLRDDALPPLYAILDEAKKDFPKPEILDEELSPLGVVTSRVTGYDGKKMNTWFIKWFGSELK